MKTNRVNRGEWLNVCLWAAQEICFELAPRPQARESWDQLGTDRDYPEGNQHPEDCARLPFLAFSTSSTIPNSLSVFRQNVTRLDSVLELGRSRAIGSRDRLKCEEYMYIYIYTVQRKSVY